MDDSRANFSSKHTKNHLPLRSLRPRGRATDSNLVNNSRTGKPRKLNVVQLPFVSAHNKSRQKTLRLDIYSKVDVRSARAGKTLH